MTNHPTIGATYMPRHPGGRAKARTVVWCGDAPATCGWSAHAEGHSTVGYVADPSRPRFAEGHDSWTSLAGWRAWVRKHDARAAP